MSDHKRWTRSFKIWKIRIPSACCRSQQASTGADWGLAHIKYNLRPTHQMEQARARENGAARAIPWLVEAPGWVPVLDARGIYSVVAEGGRHAQQPGSALVVGAGGASCWGSDEMTRRISPPPAALVLLYPPPPAPLTSDFWLAPKPSRILGAREGRDVWYGTLQWFGTNQMKLHNTFPKKQKIKTEWLILLALYQPAKAPL